MYFLLEMLIIINYITYIVWFIIDFSILHLNN